MVPEAILMLFLVRIVKTSLSHTFHWSGRTYIDSLQDKLKPSFN